MIALLLVLLLLPLPVFAMPLDVMTTTIDAATKTVQFDLHFTGTPDFSSTDQYGRQADSFQLYLYAAPTPDLYASGIPSLSLIRGEELHYGAGLPIRNITIGSDFVNDPHGGGWGSVREVDPVVLKGNELTWTSTLQGLGLSPTTRFFGYGHETTRFGDSFNSFFGACSSDRPCSVPLPGMLWPTLFFGLAIIGICWWRDWMRL